MDSINAKTSTYFDLAGMNELRARAAADPDASLKEVAKQFESIFVNMMLDGARSTIQKGGLFDSAALDNYQQMLDQQMSLDMAMKNGGIGLAEQIVRQLKLTQGQPTPDGAE